MQKISIVISMIEFVTGCASAPLTSGYSQGVLDSGALTVLPTDSPATAKAKKLGVQIAQNDARELAAVRDQAKKELAAAIKAAKDANDRADAVEKKLKFWVIWGRVGITETSTLLLFFILAILFSVWRWRNEIGKIKKSVLSGLTRQ